VSLAGDGLTVFIEAGQPVREVQFALGKLAERLPARSVRLARELVPKQAAARTKATETLLIEETGL
jgi:hypothetical protein